MHERFNWSRYLSFDDSWETILYMKRLRIARESTSPHKEVLKMSEEELRDNRTGTNWKSMPLENWTKQQTINRKNNNPPTRALCSTSARSWAKGASWEITAEVQIQLVFTNILLLILILKILHVSRILSQTGIRASASTMMRNAFSRFPHILSNFTKKVEGKKGRYGITWKMNSLPRWVAGDPSK